MTLLTAIWLWNSKFRITTLIRILPNFVALQQCAFDKDKIFVARVFMPFLHVRFGFGLGNRTLIDLFGLGRTVKHCFGQSLL